MEKEGRLRRGKSNEYKEEMSGKRKAKERNKEGE